MTLLGTHLLCTEDLSACIDVSVSMYRCIYLSPIVFLCVNLRDKKKSIRHLSKNSCVSVYRNGCLSGEEPGGEDGDKGNPRSLGHPHTYSILLGG